MFQLSGHDRAASREGQQAGGDGDPVPAFRSGLRQGNHPTHGQSMPDYSIQFISRYIL